MSIHLHRWRRRLSRLRRDDRGATTLEWTLLLAMVVLPAWVIIRYGLLTLAGHYGLVTTLNQMPFP